MKILSFVLSSALLASTAAVASADPNRGGDDRGDRQGDVRGQDRDQDQNQGQYWGNDQVDSPKDHGTVVVRDHDGDHGTVIVRDQGNDWSRGRGRTVDHRMPVAWENLATLRASGRSAFVSVDSERPIDLLKLQVLRGSASIRKLIVTFEDGSTFVTNVNAQLRTGAQQTIQLPGAAKPIASVQLKLGWNSRAQISLSAR